MNRSAQEACLEGLSAKRLRAIVDGLELEVRDRRRKKRLIAALIDGTSNFKDVLGTLQVPELRKACLTLAIETTGTKSELIHRLTTANGTAPVLPRPDGSLPTAPADRGLKSNLRRFVLDTAGAHRGREAGTKFLGRLLHAFGWTSAPPQGAEAPASIGVVEDGQRTTKAVSMLWPERSLLIDVVSSQTALEVAWKDLLRVAVQIDPVPQFVVLTNQRDIHLYDLVRNREVPRLAVPVEELPKHSEAFPFLMVDWSPGATPTIVNSGKVSREVADLVAKLYRSLKAANPERDAEVTQFTLQCIITMFAEDIGLLPPKYFTHLLYEAARKGDAEGRLRDLFQVMSARDVPEPRNVAFFNGGLFRAPVSLSLEPPQLAALTKAAEADWRHVDPHIFGSVFQGIMDDDERHASGAHYTAHDDIMRVVGPTIVEPWRTRIHEALRLEDLLEVRGALFKFRVLDPACGSGNFLYVAFRELYRLDTELLARAFREFPSTRMGGRSELKWSAGIPTSNFFGIDINSFAVELAKVTLNIAKKIAFEERRQMAAEASAQMEIDVDPSLPLDNLDGNILCEDALFAEWPVVDAIVGNPPILGDRKIRGELGGEYLDKLRRSSGVDAVVDLSCHWFRRAHDRLPPGGRAGLVGTSGIRVGKARAVTLDYLVENGGTITTAVSSVLWPGEAALNVSMVNWIKAEATGPHTLFVDGHAYPMTRIPTHLQLHVDAKDTRKIRANGNGTSMGVIFGCDLFIISEQSALPKKKLASEGVIRPVAAGTAMLTGKLSRTPKLCIFLGACETEESAQARGGQAFTWLQERLLPHVQSVGDDYGGWEARWWQPWRPRTDFFSTIQDKHRIIACSNPQARPIYAFVSARFVPTNTMQVFGFDDDYSFGIIQSSLHWEWAKAKGGRVTERIRYTAGVWNTFPWPQEPAESHIERVASAARFLRDTRATLMEANGWGLRALYQAAEVAGPHPLKEAQQNLDEAVAQAYGLPAHQDGLEFLLDLNRCVAEDEEEELVVQGPGLPSELDPSDKRWSSNDCIEPPPVED